MTQRPPQPLDAGERVLARILPRLHGRSTPGPDLDARILAAAQAAVHPARSVSTPAGPRVRWIAQAALAASMVLAVGMAWQLRPLPALESRPPTTPSSATDMAATAATPMPVPVPVPAPADMPLLTLPPPPAASTARQQTKSRGLTPDLPAVDQPPPSPAGRVAQAVQPAPMSAAPSPSVETPLPAQDVQDSARVAPPHAPAPSPADKTAMASKAQSIQQAAATAADVRNEAELAADAGFVDDPGVDIPPATAASPAVRDAWLHRIGELLEQGKRREAKDSLAEFRRRYPSAALPPALQALETEP